MGSDCESGGRGGIGGGGGKERGPPLSGGALETTVAAVTCSAASSSVGPESEAGGGIENGGRPSPGPGLFMFIDDGGDYSSGAPKWQGNCASLMSGE